MNVIPWPRPALPYTPAPRVAVGSIERSLVLLDVASALDDLVDPCGPDAMAAQCIKDALHYVAGGDLEGARDALAEAKTCRGWR